MNHYSPKRYQIPEIIFNSENLSNQPTEFKYNLRDSIDIKLSRDNDLLMKKNRAKTSFTQSFRHTTDQSATLSNMISKGYKYFQPRSRRLNDAFAHIPTYHKPQYDTLKKNYHNEPQTTQPPQKVIKFKSMKEISDNSKDQNSVFKKNDKLWSSIKLIHLPPEIQELKTPERLKRPKNIQFPYTFAKKNKLLYTTPKTSNYQNFDEISTKYESSMNSVQFPIKLLTLKQVKKESVRSPVLDDFSIIKHLGEGRFGSVSMAIHKITGLLVALKKVKKAVIKSHKLENQFTMEIKMQLYLSHSNLLKLYGYFDDSQNIYLILELMQEGTLFNKLRKQKQKHFDECTTSQRMKDILHGIKYMHNLEIAHRDIKPQNIVMSNGVCKVCDFGWAAVCENRRTTLCGTIDYAPPEVLEGKQYGITMDLWCLGVLCYELLVGKAPFYHVSRKQTMQKIIKADTRELKIPEQLSREAIDFINKFLVKDPDQRMFAQDALLHNFIQMYMERDEQQLRGKYQ